MFKATVITLSLVLTSFSASAQVVSAEIFGLTPETGYLVAVQEPSACTSADQILYKPAVGTNFHPFITKCNGSNIGWVTKVVNGADLVINQYPQGELNFNIVTRNSNTNIYTCNASRDDEFDNEEKKPSRDEETNFSTLLDLKKRKASFKIELFYNQYVMSGKCIGRITAL